MISFQQVFLYQFHNIQIKGKKGGIELHMEGNFSIFAKNLIFSP